MSTFTIGIPIIDKFDLMDVANPYEIFHWTGPFTDQEHRVDAKLIGHECDVSVASFNGAQLKTQAQFSDFNGVQLDAIFIPGGGDDYIAAAIKDEELLNFVRAQAPKAKWVASVCTGAFVLAQAGLLDGVQATTHWMYQARLQSDYTKIEVVNAYPRFVVDRKFMTGGGISSGIDEALFLAGKIASEQVGRDIELAIQYHPQPPYGTGDPSIADYKTWKRVTTDLAS